MTTASESPTGGWSDPEQAEWYLERIGRLEARRAGEQVLADLLPPTPASLLDLGCGDGRLAALVLARCPSVTRAVAVDRSPPMLEAARERFADEPRVEVREGDLGGPLASLGIADVDVVVSGFAIHHLVDARKQELFAEVADQLRPGGVFANLEVIRSATPELHAAFRTAIGRERDDPADRLVDVETQLGWMRAAGLDQVDCLWRWRGFALLVGQAPSYQSVGR
jgi:SAM-dependent methyltransferase